MTEPAKSPAPHFVCPFCGNATPDQPRCAHCSGPLDPLSRQATQNAMGPWFVRDEQQPFRPGCSYETILMMAARGKITADTILRGPSTSQFWYPAKRVPGVAHRLAGGGVCHSCQQPVTTESECPRCGAVFHADPDRQFLGLMPVRALPGSGLPLPDARPAAPSQPAQSVPAIALPQPIAPLARVSNPRLEAENAALRRRAGILLGIAAGCALVALGAIWFLASGLGQAGPAPASSSPPIAQGRTPSPAQSNTESVASPPTVAEKQQLQPSASPPASPADPSTTQPSPERPSEPGKNPDSAPAPSDELAKLRATRWP